MTAASPSYPVSLSAHFEYLLVDNSNKESAQEKLHKLYREYNPDLKVSWEKHLKKDKNGRFNFHVSFVSTKPIDSQEHWAKLKIAFAKIIKQHIHQLVFKPGQVTAYLIGTDGQYLAGRAPDDSPIVLVPENRDDFMQVHREIVAKLKELNAEWNTKYELDDDHLPSHYTPHATIVHRNVLSKKLYKNTGVERAAFIALLDSIKPTQPLTMKDHNYSFA